MLNALCGSLQPTSSSRAFLLGFKAHTLLCNPGAAAPLVQSAVRSLGTSSDIARTAVTACTFCRMRGGQMKHGLGAEAPRALSGAPREASTKRVRHKPLLCTAGACGRSSLYQAQVLDVWFTKPATGPVHLDLSLHCYSWAAASPSNIT